MSKQPGTFSKGEAAAAPSEKETDEQKAARKSKAAEARRKQSLHFSPKDAAIYAGMSEKEIHDLQQQSTGAARGGAASPPSPVNMALIGGAGGFGHGSADPADAKESGLAAIDPLLDMDLEQAGDAYDRRQQNKLTDVEEQYLYVKAVERFVKKKRWQTAIFLLVVLSGWGAYDWVREKEVEARAERIHHAKEVWLEHEHEVEEAEERTKDVILSIAAGALCLLGVLLICDCPCCKKTGSKDGTEEDGEDKRDDEPADGKTEDEETNDK